MSSLECSLRDQDSRLTRLALRVLSWETQPAELNTETMAKQLEGIDPHIHTHRLREYSSSFFLFQECKRSAQREISALSQLLHANTNANGEGHDLEAEQQLEGQWSAVLWDASAAVVSKETELGLVTDYNRQMQNARSTLERLQTELNNLKT